MLKGSETSSQGAVGFELRGTDFFLPILNVLCSTFMSDAARLWNKAPDAIKNSTSLFQAKINIRTYVSTLPI